MTEKKLTTQIPICERLKAARKARGYKNANDFADKLGIVRGTYSQHERGTRNLKEDSLTQYAEALGINKEWLRTGNGMPSFEGVNINQEILCALEPARISQTISTPAAFLDPQLFAAIFEIFLNATYSNNIKPDFDRIGNMAFELYQASIASASDSTHRIKTLPLLAKPYLELLKHAG